MLLELIITKIQSGKHDISKEYLSTDGESEYSFSSNESIDLGSVVLIEGDIESGKINLSKLILLSGDEAKAVSLRIIAKLKKSIMLDSPSLLSDSMAEKLLPQIKEIASILLIARRLNRYALIRFHGDADGVCGALAISAILPNAKAFQQNSAVYSVWNAHRDIEALIHQSNPIAILVDFGSGDASNEGLKMLVDSGIDTILIDHHPVSVFPSGLNVLNAQIGSTDSGLSTKYTAGYLCCEILNQVCREIGAEVEKANILAHAACAGDKSTIFELDENDQKRAMVLDFVSSHAQFGNKLSFYSKVLSDDELYYSMAGQADEEITAVAEKAMQAMKKTEGLVTIATISLDRFVRKGEWPPSGKVTTKLFEMINSSKPLIVIGSTERSIILRVNDAAIVLNPNLSANALAEKMKITMSDFVEGGGGHVKAGAIRVKVGFVKDVIGELVREIAKLQ